MILALKGIKPPDPHQGALPLDPKVASPPLTIYPGNAPDPIHNQSAATVTAPEETRGISPSRYKNRKIRYFLQIFELFVLPPQKCILPPRYPPPQKNSGAAIVQQCFLSLTFQKNILYTIT